MIQGYFPGGVRFCIEETGMIIVNITMTVKPDKYLEFRQTLLSMIGPTENEAGCLSHAVSQDISDKNCFSLMQTWQSSNDLDRHLKSPRFGVLLGSKSLLNEPLQVQIHTVSQTKGMEAIQTARNRWS